MKIQVQQLQAGDIMKGSKETVVGWSIGIRTPSGKVDIILEKNGHKRSAQWGKYTLVNIEERT